MPAAFALDLFVCDANQPRRTASTRKWQMWGAGGAALGRCGSFRQGSARYYHFRNKREGEMKEKMAPFVRADRSGGGASQM